VLLGARQVGKSTLARTIAQQTPEAVFLDLESPVDRARLDNPAAFFAAHRSHLVVLDEVQSVPELFTQLRPEIDAARQPGRFLLLGSASGTLLRQTAESLAGRVSYMELPPLQWQEIQSEVTSTASDSKQLLALQNYWQRGGMPLSLLATSDAKSLRWRNDYLQSLVRRDLPTLGITIPSETLWRFLRMLAHQHGQLFNASALAVAMGGISPITVSRYLDIFCEALIVRRVEPYFNNLNVDINTSGYIEKTQPTTSFNLQDKFSQELLNDIVISVDGSKSDINQLSYILQNIEEFVETIPEAGSYEIDGGININVQAIQVKNPDIKI
jgi:predicted AAA+ superfamily ATPase